MKGGSATRNTVPALPTMLFLNLDSCEARVKRTLRFSSCAGAQIAADISLFASRAVDNITSLYSLCQHWQRSWASHVTALPSCARTAGWWSVLLPVWVVPRRRLASWRARAWGAERLLVLRWHSVGPTAHGHQLISRGDESLLFRRRGVLPLRQEALLRVVPYLLLLLLGRKSCSVVLLPRLLLMLEMLLLLLLGMLLLLLPRPLRPCATTQLGFRPWALTHFRTVFRAHISFSLTVASSARKETASSRIVCPASLRLRTSPGIIPAALSPAPAPAPTAAAPSRLQALSWRRAGSLAHLTLPRRLLCRPSQCSLRKATCEA